MQIEVSKQTFRAIISVDDVCNKIETKELYREFYFTNKKLNQTGIVVENFISFTQQYYLVDINA